MAPRRSPVVSAFVHLTFVVLGIVAMAVPARADQNTATIRVQVITNGAAMPSGAVLAVAPGSSSSPLAWSVPIDATGAAVIRGLPAATYTLTLTIAGVASSSLTLAVGSGEIVVLDVSTGAPATKSGWTFEERDRYRTGQAVVFDARDLQMLPSSHNIWSFIETADAYAIVDSIDNGGLGTARAARIGGRGASFTTTTFSFGGVDVTDAAQPGLPLVFADPAILDTLSATTAGAPIEVMSPGPNISLIVKRPAAAPGASLHAALTSAGMAARSASVPQLDSWTDVGAEYDGPIGPRAGVLFGGSFTRLRAFDAARLERSSAIGSFFNRIDVHRSAQDEVTILDGVQGLARPYAGGSPYEYDSAAAGASRVRALTERQTMLQGHVIWEHRQTNGSAWTFRGGVDRASETPDWNPAITFGRFDRVLDGAVTAPPSASTSSRASAAAEYSPNMRAIGWLSHSVHAGVTFEHGASTTHVIGNVPLLETVDGLPARVWQFVAPAGDSHRGVTEMGIYASDEITPGDHLSINAGVRLDLSSGSAAGASGVAWRTLLPRVAARWALAPSVTVVASYSRYRPHLSLDVAGFGDPNGVVANVFRWNGPDATGAFTPAQIGTLVARAGDGSAVASIDPNLRAPTTSEVTFGVETHWTGRTSVRATAIVRHEHSLVQQVNTGVPIGSYRVFTLPDQGPDFTSPEDDRLLVVYDRLPASFGLDHYLLTNPAGGDGKYEGLDVSVEHAGDRLRLRLGALVYRTDGPAANVGFRADENDQGVIGEASADPNASTYTHGRLFFDRSYVLKWTTSYRAAHGVDAAAVIRYQDGQPFARLVVVPNLAQGPEALMAYPNGGTRFTYTLTLDARIEKSITFTGLRLGIAVEGFNLLNAAAETQENAVSGVTFRVPTAFQPPRTLRLSARVLF